MATPVPCIDPARPRPKMKPFTAWRHMQKLIADKEDTEQVFHIIEALNGDSVVHDFDRFLASEHGAGEFAKRAYLPDLLDDHDIVGAMPEGSVGRAYVDFMTREGLSAAGLVAESEAHRKTAQDFDDDLAWYINRLRDTHDLYHVLSGYGRDALGEAALLKYTHSQHRGRGIAFIAFMGARQIAKHVPASARIKEVMVEARDHGHRAQRVVDQDIAALLKEPLESARARIGIAPPLAYKAALRVFAESDLTPMLNAA